MESIQVIINIFVIIFLISVPVVFVLFVINTMDSVSYKEKGYRVLSHLLLVNLYIPIYFLLDPAYPQFSEIFFLSFTLSAGLILGKLYRIYYIDE